MADYGKHRRRRWRKNVDREANHRMNVDRGRVSVWARVARRNGLRIEDESEERVVFRGEHAGAAIEVVRSRRTPRTFEWTIVVARADVPDDLVVKPETAVTRARKIIGGDDVRTGSEGFDFLVFLAGDDARLVGALDANTRRIAYDLVARGARIEKSALTLLRRTNEPNRAPEHLRRDIVDAALLLRRLAASTDHARRRLVDNAHDDHDDVRIANLDMLRKRYPYDIGTHDWPLEPNGPPGIAWRIALMSSRTSVAELLRWSKDRALVRTVRAAFFERLVQALPARDARDAIASHLDGPLAGAARRTLLSRADQPGTLRDLDLISVEHLFDDATTQERIRLATALGDVGSDVVVPLLVEYTSGFWAPGALKDAARRAVAKIERRMQRHRGHLSVAEGDGRLSFSNEGGLAITDD